MYVFLKLLTTFVFSRTIPSSVLGLDFGGLTASLLVFLSSPVSLVTPLPHRRAGGEDAEQLCCSSPILLEVVLFFLLLSGQSPFLASLNGLESKEENFAFSPDLARDFRVSARCFPSPPSGVQGGVDLCRSGKK